MLSVVIPTQNEAAVIGARLDEIEASLSVNEIIVADGGFRRRNAGYRGATRRATHRGVFGARRAIGGWRAGRYWQLAFVLACRHETRARLVNRDYEVRG